MPDAICDSCSRGDHVCPDVFVCACSHVGCPDQLTIDDALAATTEETR